MLIRHYLSYSYYFSVRYTKIIDAKGKLRHIYCPSSILYMLNKSFYIYYRNDLIQALNSNNLLRTGYTYSLLKRLSNCDFLSYDIKKFYDSTMLSNNNIKELLSRFIPSIMLEMIYTSNMIVGLKTIPFGSSYSPIIASILHQAILTEFMDIYNLHFDFTFIIDDSLLFNNSNSINSKVVLLLQLHFLINYGITLHQFSSNT